MANPAYLSEPDRYMSSGNAHWPARLASAIAKSDTLSVGIGPGAVYAKALWIGGAGDVTVITAGDNSNSGAGTPVTFSAVPAGTYLNVQVRAVMATGTTATNMVGLAD